MAYSKVRVIGGGNTLITVGQGSSNANRIMLLASAKDAPGQVLKSPVEIQPVGSEYPVEIVTAYGQKAGTLTLQVWSVWGKDGWEVLLDAAGIGDSSASNKYPDLLSVLEAQRKAKNGIGIYKVEKIPAGVSGTQEDSYRVRTYHDAVITNIDASESITNEDMDAKVTITIMYTRSTITSNASVGNLTGFFDANGDKVWSGNIINPAL